jgi:hypothetical protein
MCPIDYSAGTLTHDQVNMANSKPAGGGYGGGGYGSGCERVLRLARLGC